MNTIRHLVVSTADYWFQHARSEKYKWGERFLYMENALNHTENTLIAEREGRIWQDGLPFTREPGEFFLVRPKGMGNHGKSWIPTIVQWIEGQLYTAQDEINPLRFGRGNVPAGWDMQWMELPKEWEQ